MPGAYSQESLESHFKQMNERLRSIEQQITQLSGAAGIPYEAPLAEVPPEWSSSRRPGTPWKR